MNTRDKNRKCTLSQVPDENRNTRDKNMFFTFVTGYAREIPLPATKTSIHVSVARDRGPATKTLYKYTNKFVAPPP